MFVLAPVKSINSTAFKKGVVSCVTPKAAAFVDIDITCLLLKCQYGV